MTTSRTSAALARVGCALLVACAGGGCGAKTDLKSNGHEPLQVLPECRTEGEARPCRTICGEGSEFCVDGTWQFCDAERPVPPKLEAVVRDFSDVHPDFEQGFSRGGLELGIVEFHLGDDDTPVYAGNPTTRTTTGADNFRMWFHDAPGHNLRIEPVFIELVPSPTDPSMFIYRDNRFFPIDGRGFGNEGRVHNYHFTLQVQTAFRYVGGEIFRFSGDDDLWVFINRRLAIDLGGRHETLSAEVILDEAAVRLRLEVGEVYPLHLFFAERHTVASNFNIETTIAEFEFCD